MNKGKIIEWRGTYGFIEGNHGKRHLFFHISDADFEKRDAREGLTVQYRVGQGRKGPAAKDVRMEKSSERSKKRDRFLNPYNFVRPIYRKRESDHVLGNCPPPPHDRYVGRTGRITCKLTVETPLFVTDSHAVEIRQIEQKDERGKSGGVTKDHPVYRFFRAKENPAIPASTLRGAIRSIFEASTNSCFSSLTDKPLSTHVAVSEARKLVPARVEKDEDGNWQLRLLTGFAPLRVDGLPRSTPMYPAWVMRYGPKQQLRSSPTVRANRQTPYANRSPIKLNGLKHKSRCYAIVERMNHPPREVRGKMVGEFDFWNVVNVADDPSEFDHIPSNARVVQGWLCITNQNIQNKHDERLFFHNSENCSGAKVIPLKDRDKERYEDLIKDYQERHRDEVQKRRKRNQPLHKPLSKKNAALSNFVYEPSAIRMECGDLVYIRLKGTDQQPEVDFIAPVSVPRVTYENSIADLLDPTKEYSHLRRCVQYEELCPACRTFGWVHDSPEKDTKITAFASRVRFSHAEFDKDDLQQDEKTLAILSSPKPTTTLFYLKKKKKNQSTLPNGRTDYDSSNAHLRGRKMYRHHNKLVWEEATRSIEDASDQNRTIRDFLPKGKSAEFTVEFHNFADEELGALLWSLELGEGMFHRVGYGKPLGFGSVKIEVTQLELLNPVSRYSSDLQDGWEEKTSQRSKLVQAFKDEFGRLYGDGKTFNAMDDVRDLRALLSVPENPDVAIHYPRSDPNPQASDENFTWFLGNKKKRHQPLPFASDDKDGFEYWDRYGKS